jgi:hypothetical protein
MSKPVFSWAFALAAATGVAAAFGGCSTGAEGPPGASRLSFEIDAEVGENGGYAGSPGTGGTGGYAGIGGYAGTGGTGGYAGTGGTGGYAGAGGSGGDTCASLDACASCDGSVCTTCQDTSCDSCSEAGVENAVDEYLAEFGDGAYVDDALGGEDGAALQSVAPLPLTHQQAINRCFGITEWVKYNRDRFNCQHFAYYAKVCLRRYLGANAWTASIWCKDCSRTDLYPKGQIGHDVVGYYSSTLKRCCIAEAQHPEGSDGAARECRNDVASEAECPWSTILAEAHRRYCAGEWFNDPTRKAECERWGSGQWHSNLPDPPCTAQAKTCLVDGGIIPEPPAFVPCNQRKTQTECQAQPWPRPNSSCGWVWPSGPCRDP